MLWANKLPTFALIMGLALIFNGCYADNIVVYGGDSFEPQTYLDNGKPAGIILALFDRISKDTGDTYTFKLVPWKRALAESALGHGGIVNFTWTKERAKNYDFSDPTYQNKLRLIVLNDHVFPFNTLADLNGKIIGFPLGSSFGDAFDTAISTGVIISETDTNHVSRLKKLLLGRIDVAIIGTTGLKKAIQSDSLLVANQHRFTVLPNPLLQDWLYLAFPKSMHMKPAILRFNKSLLALKKSKEYQTILAENTP
jgi:polar amino acid transport system substrate-binding protein